MKLELGDKGRVSDEGLVEYLSTSSGQRSQSHWTGKFFCGRVKLFKCVGNWTFNKTVSYLKVTLKATKVHTFLAANTVNPVSFEIFSVNLSVNDNRMIDS